VSFQSLDTIKPSLSIIKAVSFSCTKQTFRCKSNTLFSLLLWRPNSISFRPRAIRKCQYVNCPWQRVGKKAGIGVKSEVVYFPSSSVHGKCIETVAIRTEESDLKKINTRNLNYACIVHKRKEDESVRI